MPTFSYSARNKEGLLVRGKVTASDIKESKKEIFKMGFIPVDVYPGEKKPLTGVRQTIKNYFDGVTLEEMLMFNQQFHTIYLVGVPLLRGLQMIESQTENEYFRGIIQRITADVSDGQALDQAFAKHPKVFDTTYVNLVRSGMASGKLDTVLENISKLTEQQVENRARIKSALFYPKIVVFFMAVVFFVVVYLIIPKIKVFFDKFGAELPAITRFTVGVSDLMVSYWYLVATVGAGGYFLLKRYLATEKGREKWDSIQLKLPIFGSLIQQIECANFASILELLNEGGVPVIEGLRLTRDSLSNTIFKKEIDRVIAAVERGEGMSKTMVESPVFPAMVGGLMSVGEEAGAITKVLNRISTFYRMQINYRLANLSKVIEPILLVIIFGVVLVLALSIFLPLWKMNSLIKR
jgi:MSHA biogenesis protein MshG